MKQIDNKLPDWIEKHATLGPNVLIEGTGTDENLYWYLLKGCCPLIFESYAIVLHPYWINWKVKDLVNSGLNIQENQMDKGGVERVSWTKFFKLYGFNFNIKTANQTQEQIRQTVIKDEQKESDWPVYLWFPSEGNCETEELKYIFSTLTDLYGDLSANFYYNLLKTQDWMDDKMYKGKLSEFNELATLQNLRDNPTAVFPDNKTWCIVSDYDLNFTYIGGTKEFINRLTTNQEFDIYEIKPMFKEKQKDPTSH